MHRDVVTHVAVSAAEFFITGSADGVLSFPFCYLHILCLISVVSFMLHVFLRFLLYYLKKLVILCLGSDV